jgi:hypothetical protein
MVSTFEKWTEWVQGLTEWLLGMDRIPGGRETLHCAACSLGMQVTQSFQAVSYNSLWTASVAQDCIRWINFTEGKLSKCLRQPQAAYYRKAHSKCTADQWAAGMVTEVVQP